MRSSPRSFVRLALTVALLAATACAPRSHPGLHAYVDAARRHPTSPSAQLELAQALDRSGRLREALRAYRSYASLDPAEPRAHLLVAWALVELRRPTEAIAEFALAAALDPRLPSAHHGLAVTLSEVGRKAEARRAYEEVVRLDPGSAEAWGALAVLAWDGGSRNDALSHWDAAVQAESTYFDRRPLERRRWEEARRERGAPPSRAVGRVSRVVTPPLVSTPGGSAARPRGPSTSGSGVVVTTDGFVLTNRHVVKGCASVTVRADSGGMRPARVVAMHAVDDLALLKVDASWRDAASFRTGHPIRPGDDVVAIGFPLAGLLADEANVTTGSVNALAGMHNDAQLLQMSAPVQQGSSGGPLFDAGGNVVGIVVTKLNAKLVAEETGDFPQNVNFAIKAQVARDFLDDHEVRYRLAPSDVRRSNADVGELGRRVTTLVECYR